MEYGWNANMKRRDFLKSVAIAPVVGLVVAPVVVKAAKPKCQYLLGGSRVGKSESAIGDETFKERILRRQADLESQRKQYANTVDGTLDEPTFDEEKLLAMQAEMAEWRRKFDEEAEVKKWLQDCTEYMEKHHGAAIRNMTVDAMVYGKHNAIIENL